MQHGDGATSPFVHCAICTAVVVDADAEISTHFESLNAPLPKSLG